MSLNPVRPQRVGNLRDRIVWQEKVGEEWQDRETEPARVEPLKGRELYEAEGSQRYATADYRVFARYRHVQNTANWRVLWLTGHLIADEESPPSLLAERLIMDIKGVMNPDERRRFIELTVQNTASASYPPTPEPEPETGYSFTITAGKGSGFIGYIAGTIGSISAQPVPGGTITTAITDEFFAGYGEIVVTGNGLSAVLDGKSVYVDAVKIEGGEWSFGSGTATWTTMENFPELEETEVYAVEIKP